MVIHTVIQLGAFVSMVNNTHANSALNNNIYNKNNIREYNIVHGDSIQVGKHCYLVCIPDLPAGITKMEVARAVERRILYSSTGEIQYVKNVVFIQGFDEESKNAIENSCYKIAIVNIEMPPSDDGVYTDYENDFYESVCRGDIVIGEWSNSFLMANPNYYFKSLAATAHEEAEESTQTTQTAAQQVDAAFQKWKHDTEIEKYKRKVDDDETEIRDLQNTVNELVESLRFLSRKRSGDGLLGLKDASKSLSSFISTLNNKYARICVSDVEFLEINKNMKLKKMLGLVVNGCDDCDACQELIHSLDYIEDEKRRRDLFVQIEKLICRINHSVRKFQLLHLYAERCIFGLKNRAVFTEFASFLNTAVEIVEEVTSRNCTHTQDVDFVKCYGIRATSKQEQQEQQQQQQEAAGSSSCVGDYGGSWGNWGSWDGGNGYDGITVNNNHYDYYENADNVETDDADADADEEMTSVSQMLAEFETMRALTATATTVATAASGIEDTEDTVKVEQEQQVIVNESEEVEVVITTATAVKEEQEDKEKETNNNNDANQNKPKGKWFSWL
jgi:hypothetical protein